LLTGCNIATLSKSASEAIGTGEVLPLAGLEGRWSGPVRPKDAACGQVGHGLMRIGGNEFAFDPFESTTIINGKVEGAALNGVLTREGGGHRSLSISFTGRANAETSSRKVIEGVLSSGHCTWQVTLTRA